MERQKKARSRDVAVIHVVLAQVRLSHGEPIEDDDGLETMLLNDVIGDVV